MPCYRCGERQTDPDRGISPWRRGVLGASQVLICPACQAAPNWEAELDRCPMCGSAHLARRLGEVECHECGRVVEASEGDGPSGEADESSADDDGLAGLAEEVERALARVLRRTAGSSPFG